MGIPEREQREAIFGATVTEKFSHTSVRHQITYPGSSNNTRQDMCLKKSTPRHVYSNFRESNKRKIFKEVKGGKNLTCSKDKNYI